MKPTPTTLPEALAAIARIETAMDNRSRCLMQILAFVQNRSIDGNMTTAERNILRAGHDIMLQRAASGDPWGDDELLMERVDEIVSPA